MLKTSFNDFENYLKEDINFIPKNNVALYRKVIKENNDIGFATKVSLLNLIKKEKSISQERLLEYMENPCNSKLSWKWMKDNNDLIDKEISENQEVSYSLTAKGERVLENLIEVGDSIDYFRDKAEQELKEQLEQQEQKAEETTEIE